MDNLDKEIANLEDMVDKYSMFKNDVEARLNDKFGSSSKSDTAKSEDNLIVEKLIQFDDMKHTKAVATTYEEKVNAISEAILQEQDILNNLNNEIKTNYVPIVVFQNLNQAIKEIDVSG